MLLSIAYHWTKIEKKLFRAVNIGKQ